ncbi:unnamed protein product [Hyaloperonospora brassicae]|uniref:RxLR effector candidate protein n=1 Tax=Hyaloperonospora brassicae TaxID=162125 RepID=A0AAV0TMD6_HYABA|nr:unnamed protein product [Hyaloperonospora brassicae]
MVPLETAGSTITGDEEANGAAGSTPSVLSRTNVTLPVTLRTGTSHDDAGIETDDEGQHDVEERTVASLQQSRLTTNHEGKAVEDKLRDLSETMQKEEGVWDYKIVAESLVSTESRGQELQAEIEGAVNALLKLRKDPGMKTHADRIHRELFFMYRKRLDESLVKVYLNARVTPEEFLEMTRMEKGVFITQHDLHGRDKMSELSDVVDFLKNYVTNYHREYGYTSQKYKDLHEVVTAMYKSIYSHEVGLGRRT